MNTGNFTGRNSRPEPLDLLDIYMKGGEGRRWKIVFFIRGDKKNEIEDKRKALNQLILVDADKEDILKFSIELDRLIDKYYSLKLNKKNRADD